MTLEELIADSRQRRDEQRQRRDTDEAERRRDFEDRQDAAIADAISRVDDSLPEPLRPFVVYAGPPPTEEQVNGYPDFWTPVDFKIAEAPGLFEIEFITTATTPTGFLHVAEIRIRNSTDFFKYRTNWTEAIADAADFFEPRTIKTDRG